MNDRTKKRSPMPSLDAAAFSVVAIPQPDPVQLATAGTSARTPTGNDGKRDAARPASQRRVQLNVRVSEETRRKLLHRKADTGRSIDELVGTALERLLNEQAK